MNDTELDDVLNQWKAPEPGPELRRRIEKQLPREKRRFAWPSWHVGKGLLVGLAAGAAMCLVGVTAAFPQAFTPSSVRFSVSSEYIDYDSQGVSTIREYRASTAHSGREIILTRNDPNNLLMSLHNHLFDIMHRIFDLADAPAGMTSGCALPTLSAIGHETILKYQTIVQQTVNPDGSRYTEWRSPDLDCIVMKYVVEKPGTNGRFQVTSERRPILVKMSR